MILRNFGSRNSLADDIVDVPATSAHPEIKNALDNKASRCYMLIEPTILAYRGTRLTKKYCDLVYSPAPISTCENGIISGK